MFGLFKKKEKQEEPAAAPVQENQDQWKALKEEFQPETITLLAVTGANGWGGPVKDGLCMASIGLTAWREENSEEPAQRGKALLVTLADDKLLTYLRRRALPDSILQVDVRPSEDGKRFLMTELPQPVVDPELKAILEEQKQPVSFWEQGLGTFALIRSVGWFEAEADWLGQTVRLDFDQDENRADCLMYFHQLMEHKEDWDRRVRSFAAEQLLSLANDWEQDAAGNEEREPEEITQEQFMERLELDAVQISETGAVEFWFNDGDMFWGHSVHVTGSLDKGPESAQMEG